MLRLTVIAVAWVGGSCSCWSDE